ncbi:MAG TPA: 1-deoxy-D-xylulose-5-phosphate reductoisomerase [Alphaproteobacteria bacterium]|nr:1-deoxy-D-xylulose-5-phosphate reductoisomerase [Alphaproteobacteria bacterium]
MKKKVTILGATGTIGQNTKELILNNPDKFEVETVISHQNTSLLAKTAIELKAKTAIIYDHTKYNDLKEQLKNTNINISAGEAATLDASCEKVDIYISGAVGFCALKPTLKAISSGNKIGLANKECLVCAGDMMINEVKKNNSQLIPIDSEHNAIYQIFDFDRKENVEKIILTASGGPFRSLNKAEFSKVTKEMAVNHPNWKMGEKISVDSATMMNKGLEVIEAYYLFGVEKERVKILVHPESIIHGLVQYNDGSILAGMASPDMKIPISFALNHPERLKNNSNRVNLAKIGRLNFEEPDHEKFPAIKLSREALNIGQKACIALNSANEIAVESFLKGLIRFTQIPYIVEMVIDEVISSGNSSVSDIDEVFLIDETSRKLALQLISKNIE